MGMPLSLLYLLCFGCGGECIALIKLPRSFEAVPLLPLLLRRADRPLILGNSPQDLPVHIAIAVVESLRPRPHLFFIEQLREEAIAAGLYDPLVGLPELLEIHCFPLLCSFQFPMEEHLKRT